MWLSGAGLSKRVKIEVVTQGTTICHGLPRVGRGGGCCTLGSSVWVPGHPQEHWDASIVLSDVRGGRGRVGHIQLKICPKQKRVGAWQWESVSQASLSKGKSSSLDRIMSATVVCQY